MYKFLSLLVVLALAMVAFASEEPAQDQETAEQFFLRYGYYPSYYYGGVRGYPFAGAYPYSAYPYYGYRAAFPAYGYNYGYAY